MKYVLLLALVTVAPVIPSIVGASENGAFPLTYLEGCWETTDGGTRERWVSEGPDHLFGSSVTRREGAVVFFEQMRIDRDAAGWRFHAYPRGTGPTTFRATAQGRAKIRFENAANDHPQRITYAKTERGLEATIAQMDGSRSTRWRFTPCAP